MKWQRTDRGAYVSGDWMIEKHYDGWHYGFQGVCLGKRRKLADAKKHVQENGESIKVEAAEKIKAEKVKVKLAVANEICKKCRELDKGRNAWWRIVEKKLGITLEDVRGVRRYGKIEELAEELTDELQEYSGKAEYLQPILDNIVETFGDQFGLKPKAEPEEETLEVLCERFTEALKAAHDTREGNQKYPHLYAQVMEAFALFGIREDVAA